MIQFYDGKVQSWKTKLEEQKWLLYLSMVLYCLLAPQHPNSPPPKSRALHEISFVSVWQNHLLLHALLWCLLEFWRRLLVWRRERTLCWSNQLNHCWHRRWLGLSQMTEIRKQKNVLNWFIHQWNWILICEHSTEDGHNSHAHFAQFPLRIITNAFSMASNLSHSIGGWEGL